MCGQHHLGLDGLGSALTRLNVRRSLTPQVWSSSNFICESFASKTKQSKTLARFIPHAKIKLYISSYSLTNFFQIN